MDPTHRMRGIKQPACYKNDMEAPDGTKACNSFNRYPMFTDGYNSNGSCHGQDCLLCPKQQE